MVRRGMRDGIQSRGRPAASSADRYARAQPWRVTAGDRGSRWSLVSGSANFTSWSVLIPYPLVRLRQPCAAPSIASRPDSRVANAPRKLPCPSCARNSPCTSSTNPAKSSPAEVSRMATQRPLAGDSQRS
ncbi:hypothetical protein ACFPRL_19595 [Pseudoclavibacter helvolus]